MQIQIANATIGSKITHCCLMKNFSVRYGNTEKEGRFISEYADTTKVLSQYFLLIYEPRREYISSQKEGKQEWLRDKLFFLNCHLKHTWWVFGRIGTMMQF